ncbi:MAG: DUF881 domain-containing protein [Clostridium sp.]|jgi:uncharacterized protein YlxW (UPF0749 family)|uniref:DUF881 domain-containing protein n=1 Tax=Clostridium sp. TaxID=1506 RepID=UPI0025BD0E0D|nr:DUF881 domain-containing protein [Clostridium sp.]MCH3964185.1 DUF881 domain-containing protein [Clostridium sp.]MCI1715366.1 DUF881 domain-containing protein [Clostridium sp.]MCI1799843.1 DUF881 domain-containing protein [Clostridium sp.]MCI1813549.1 DUF881 domain-containing protein [Clostridium sp.]MCI1870661.1 DUF881 domain-containing protein [Clostridium sp.]
MKNNEANIFVFMASLIIGILISMNISISQNNAKENKRVFLSSEQYQEAYTYRNKLRNDILGYMQQYNDYSNKLRKYENDDRNQVEVKKNIEEELKQNRIILGETEVEGQGIKIYIEDGITDDSMDAFEYQMRIVHNTDIIEVINDLNNAGAEAISINGHRITDRSEIYCSGPFLRVNGVKIAAPFLIYSIGNKDVLHSYMMDNENYLKIMMSRKIFVSVDEVDNLKVPAYNGNYNMQFMKEDK